ncbi:hypothetical protein QWE_05803 [Agrobacterium albertimagni AOL15]|uniref:DUF4393 domain-containing protein n=1 Tax=Agrobacterium albertimagni AOL15 TaxID=1156935 RepID=K2QHG3_9HYPH|nr:hypothetical protein [Agrobacterium albertimagni]EKF60556.1 hypothetical protein QWE_05803 [Agrobacterium albertimagni AOL15]
MANKVPDFPKDDDRSLAYHVAQTTLGAADVALPGAGYALQQMVSHFIGEPLQKRREQWFEEVGRGLLELQERFEEFDPSTLSDNEDFVSAVYEASHLALKSGKEYKRKALLNAVLNIALGQTVEETLRGRFMGLLDVLSKPHLRVLSVLAAPADYPQCVEMSGRMSMGAQEHIIRAEISTEEIPNDLFEIVLSDLGREGLFDGNLKGMGSSGTFLVKRTTTAGDHFLAFISSPLD